MADIDISKMSDDELEKLIMGLSEEDLVDLIKQIFPEEEE